MTHAWLNIVAILMASFGSNGVVPLEQTRAEAVETGFVVVDRIDERGAWVEGENGGFWLPKGVVSGDAIREGAVIEWRIAGEDREKRLASATERLRRMEEQSQKMYDL